MGDEPIRFCSIKRQIMRIAVIKITNEQPWDLAASADFQAGETFTAVNSRVGVTAYHGLIAMWTIRVAPVILPLIRPTARWCLISSHAL